MNDFEHSNFDESDLYEDFWITAYYWEKDGQEEFVADSQIGEVTLRKDIAHNDMPFELEINGVTYKRED